MDLDVVVPGSQWRTMAERIKDFCHKQGLVATDGYRTDNVHVRSEFGIICIYLFINFIASISLLNCFNFFSQEIKVQLLKPDAASPKETVCIEVIRAEWKFGKPDATVDFDVNNLKLKRADDVRLT